MSKRGLIAAIDRVLLDEERYAAKLQDRGDFGLAKLAWAAIGGVKRAVKVAAKGGEQTLAERLVQALHAERAEYSGLWDDADGIGTSTFARVLDLLEATE